MQHTVVPCSYIAAPKYDAHSSVYAFLIVGMTLSSLSACGGASGIRAPSDNMESLLKVGTASLTSASTERGAAEFSTSRRIEPLTLESWEVRFPDASKQLGAWVKTHPNAALSLFDWEARHPTLTEQIILWMATTSRANVSILEFERLYGGSEELETAFARHKAAFDMLADWCRSNSEAALDLAEHSHGLRWMGHYLYTMPTSFDVRLEEAPPQQP